MRSIRLLALPWVTLASATAIAQEPSPVPPVLLMGFADVDYVETERPIDEGFVLGQLVGHLSAGLSERLTFFTELSATARPDRYRMEVERAVLRYDFDDRFKLSAGRYHTPINYWNTAFHHGLWLQTTVARPEMIKFGSQLLPVHFVGVLAEGSFPRSTVGLNYAVGAGNGRHEIISRAGDAGDVDESRAVLGTIFLRPTTPFGLQVGGSFYLDDAEADGLELDERIVSAHAVWSRERPEVLAEYARILHEPEDGGETTSTDAWYAQLAWRLSGTVSELKPYVRYERIDPERDDALFAPLALEYEGAVVGVRYDFATLAALKLEYRNEKFEGEDRAGSLWLQAAFTFGPAEEAPLAGVGTEGAPGDDR